MNLNTNTKKYREKEVLNYQACGAVHKKWLKKARFRLNK